MTEPWGIWPRFSSGFIFWWVENGIPREVIKILLILTISNHYQPLTIINYDQLLSTMINMFVTPSTGSTGFPRGTGPTLVPTLQQLRVHQRSTGEDLAGRPFHANRPGTWGRLSHEWRRG